MKNLMEFSRLGVAVDGVSVSFKNERVLDRMCLNISPGEIVALLGPSGCGKSTTLRAIAGLEIPSEGEILVGDKSMINIPPHLRGIGMVFQNYALFPHMTVADNIAFGLKMQHLGGQERDSLISTTLKLVGLLSLRDNYPAQLSGGQQQRVAVARTIATRPSVLLLDEPLSALDKKLRDSMRVELRDLLKKVGITAIIVTHDQEEALAIADRVAVMSHGKIAQIGTGRELYNRPKSRFVADFVGNMNYFPGTVIGVANDHVEVDVGAEFSMKAPIDRIFNIGDRVEVTIRPEMMIMSQAKERNVTSEMNEISLRFSSEEFLGILSYMRFRDESGHTALVIRTGQLGKSEISQNERCYLRWKVEHTSCMKV